MLQKPPQNESAPLLSRRRGWLALVIFPLLLVVGIGWFAPNFVDHGQTRQHPVGGDYLQEYVGGYLVSHAAQRDQLYDPATYRSMQHDAEWLGFQWETEHYFPMVYPPFYYAAVSPLSQLEYLTAVRIWLALMGLALAGSLLLLKRFVDIPTWLLLATCIASPVLLSLTTGQKATLLLLILTASFCLWKHGKPFAAGVVFGLIAFKPHLGLPIGLIMLARRETSFVMGTLVTLGLLIVGSGLTGAQVCMDYVDVCLGFGEYVQSVGYHLEQGYSFWSFWQLVLGDAAAARTVTMVSSMAVLLGVMWFVRKPEVREGDQALRAFSAMVIATVLVSPHLYTYDLTMLVLPLALLASLALRPGTDWHQYAAPAALTAVLLGSHFWTYLARLTGIQVAVPILVVTLAWILISMQWAPRMATCRAVEPSAAC
ncbi:MAG: glycosyltransferase family 87 protein [Pirellulaceae bacterium]